jgi:signal transduction histidine kinase/ActR/RegA family two-component response regulator
VNSNSDPRVPSLRRRFGRLLIAAAAGIVGVLFVGGLALRSIVGKVEAENQRDRLARAAALFAMEAQAAKDRVEEYAFWDDTWEYAQAPDAPGAAEFVRENYIEWFPERYGDDLIRIWDRNGRLLVSWTGPDAGAGWVPDEEALFDLVRQPLGVGGFYPAPTGPMLVGAAAIQHTDYEARHEAPNGYILIARLLDSTEAHHLGTHLQEGLRFEPPRDTAPETRRVLAGGDSVETRLALAGLFGQPAAIAVLTDDRAFVRTLVRRARNVGLLTLLLGGTPLVLLWMVGWRLMIRPLAHLVGQFETMEAAGHLAPLEAAPTVAEWQLVVHTFNRTEAALRASQRQAREAATKAAHEQKLEAIGALAGGVAHDFNNLLGAILVAVSSLREELGDTVSESVETISQAGRRAAELTQQLLQFARRGSPLSRPVAPASVVASVERLCRRTFDPRVRIKVEVEQSAPTILGDPGQLEHALLNLCINARDAMPDGGTLRLAVRRVTPAEAALHGLEPLEHVALSVTDTGTGIPPEIRDRLFEPFFTTKGAGRGTGLGLAIVYGTAKAHGGTVAVESEVGRGTRFDLYLPADGSPVAEAAATAPAIAAPTGRATILVVDDEAGLRSAVTRGLRRLGYHVHEGTDGRDGLRTFQQHADEIDAVLLDLTMPEIGGTEVFRRVREIRPNLPVIVTSGYAAGNELDELLAHGATFLPKPFELADMARAVADALGGRRPCVLGPPPAQR